MKYQKSNRLALRSLSEARGLSFIELIVVMAVFSVLTTVTLFKFGTFSSNISVQTVSQDIALKIIQAQRDGSSGTFPQFINLLTQSILIPITPPWTPTFGVHFEIDNNIPTDHFIYFFDGVLPSSGQLAPNNQYNAFGSTVCDGQNTSECLDDIAINSGDQITDLCVEVPSFPCVVDPMMNGSFLSGGIDPTSLDILFSRPNLSAKIFAYDGSNTSMLSSFSSVTDAKILVFSLDKKEYKIITVYPVGQITVE